VLQKRLLTLRDKGLFLAVVSRNQLADAEKLFETRTDFPLKRDDFSAFEVNWGSKAESVGRAAAALRIGIDSILFVDDNPGELAEVASAFPAVHTLYAEENADDTARALMMYPGIFRWRVGDDDIKRVQDLAATTLREIEASIVGEATDPLAYLGELDTRLAFSFNDTRHLSRLAELSQKTNQFNLSLTRIAELEMEKLINAPDVAVVGVELNDKLSASGIIGMLVVRIREGMAEVEEICISCRALGRRLEDLMISEALCRAGQSLGGISKVTFHYDIGPRNRPAVDWLEHYSGEPTGSKAGRIDLDWNEKYAQNLIGTYPVTITWAE
jgi:FkbH-like protein